MSGDSHDHLPVNASCRRDDFINAIQNSDCHLSQKAVRDKAINT